MEPFTMEENGFWRIVVRESITMEEKGFPVDSGKGTFHDDNGTFRDGRKGFYGEQW